MARKGTVRVVGSSTLSVVPDRADLQFEVHAREGERRRAYDRAAALSKKLTSTLDSFAVPPSQRQTRAVVVVENRDPKSGAVRGYDATYRVMVRLEGDIDAGELIESAVRDAGATVVGPRWSVSPNHPRRLDAYRQAARDAADRARAYSEGLSLGVGAVLSVDEGQSAVIPRPLGGMAMASRGFAAGPEPIEVEPGEVELTAAVTVEFLLAKAGSENT
jgi:uncharacterized protein YggE